MYCLLLRCPLPLGVSCRILLVLRLQIAYLLDPVKLGLQMRRQRASVLRRKWGEECGGHLTCTSNKGSALPCLLSSLLSALFQSRTERLHFRQVSIVECQEEWSIDSAEFRATQTLLISLLTKGGGSAPKTFKQSHRQPASALKEVDRTMALWRYGSIRVFL